MDNLITVFRDPNETASETVMICDTCGHLREDSDGRGHKPGCVGTFVKRVVNPGCGRCTMKELYERLVKRSKSMKIVARSDGFIAVAESGKAVSK